MLSNGTVHIVGGDYTSRLALSEVLPVGLKSASYLSTEAFLKDAQILSPGCVLLLVDAPSKVVLRVVAALRQLGSVMPMVVIGPQGSVEIAVQSLKGGAADFLEVTVGTEALNSAVEFALAGASFPLDESELTKAKRLVGTLTPREHEVLKGISAGLSSKTLPRTSISVTARSRFIAGA